ncbi:uncharacterized protein LOC108259101 isoform X2 [Ictalurus punctatus]|uniref:Uncharacterized protein LOC108259101 isoform X2 n=1 Tax=Ictalurus punctatus TaxID=7998 RepID=A0A9F7R0G4_ICTPU|nr:uncharacterized protein LOC108259101 isoform X2 [Ictalurus punctatus]
MALQCFVLLVIFLSKCLGHTEFIYTAKDEVKLFCDTNKWETNTESDNRIDVNCTVECVHGEALKLNNTQNSCKNKDSFKVGEKCSLIASSGFYRCVTALDSGFLFPFKPSPNTVTSYIVATANEEMTNKSEERSSVELTEGEDVLLNCSVIFTEQYDNKNFVVYWIKTIGKNSTCVYSYDYDLYTRIRYNPHCNVQEERLYTLSNQTEDKITHNIRISNVTDSDAGQYLCALQVHTHNKTKGKWKIINNITVSVHKDKGPEIAGNNAALIVCVTIPILLALAIATVWFIWKKIKTSPGSQAIELQRNQNADDTEEKADIECPYAVGCGEEEIKFRSQGDTLKQEGHEESRALYSVMKLNDLYEPGV